MIQDGDMPIAVLREVMGHSSVTVTEKYAHLAPSYADAMGKAHKKLGI
jgi:site-specific recombinase XerD